MVDFVAEVRPLSYCKTSFQTLGSECDQGLSLKPYNSLDYKQLNYYGNLVDDPSDLHVQRILSDRKFSRERMTTLLERSVLSLVEKLLMGSAISRIEGTLSVSMFSDESPITVNLNKAFPRPYSDSFPRNQDIGRSFNIKIKDREFPIVDQCCEKTDGSCSPCFKLSRESSDIHSETRNSPESSLGYHSGKDSCSSSPVHDSSSGSSTPCLVEEGDEHTDSTEFIKDKDNRLKVSGDNLGSVNVKSDTAVAASAEETTIEQKPTQKCLGIFNGNGLSVDALSLGLEESEYQPEPYTCWSCEESGDDIDEDSDAEMKYEHRLVIDDNATEINEKICDLESLNKTIQKSTFTENSEGETIHKVNEPSLSECRDETKDNITDDFKDVESSIKPELTITDSSVDVNGNSKDGVGNISGTLHPQAIVTKEADGFKCKQCPTVLPDSIEVSIHVERSHGLYCCTHCYRAFTAVNNLKRHVRRHSGMKPYKCSKCSQSFFRGDELKGHMTRHGYHKQIRRFPWKKGFSNNSWVKSYLTTSQKSHKYTNLQLARETLLNDHARKQQENNKDRTKTEYLLFESMESVNLQPTDCRCKSDKFARLSSGSVVTERKVSSRFNEDANDDGQLLDLSIKKPLSGSCMDEGRRNSQSSNINCHTPIRISDQLVRDDSRNCNDSPRPVDLSRGRGAGERELAFGGGSQDENSYMPRFSRNGSAQGIHERALAAAIHEAQNADSSNLDAAHRLSNVEMSSSSNSPHATSMRRTVSAINSTSGRSTLRFNPYIKERMADFAAKFVAVRGTAMAGKRGPLQAVIPVGDDNKAIVIREQDKGRKKELSVTLVPKVKSCFQEGTLEQENRKKDIAGRQILEDKDELALDYSNPETALRCHIPTVVKSEPLSMQDENADSLVEFRLQRKQADVVSNVAVAGNGNSYSCDICRDLFGSFLELENHSEEVHKRYLCEHCKKSFTARPNRDRHVRYHTGERPYKCDLCVMAFFRGDDLKYHRTTRHPSAQPYVCTHCAASFTWGRDLERHLRHSKCKVKAEG